MKTKTILMAISLLLLCNLHSNAQQKWTLEQCIDTALENNRNIKQQKIAFQTKEIDYKQAQANRLPNLNASAGQNLSIGRSLSVDNTYQNSNSQTTSFGLSSNLVIYNGLRIKNTIDARRAELLASGADVEKIEREIIINVSTVFLQVLQYKELLANAESQLQITKENIARRNELIVNGKMAEGEIYELQAQEAKEELALVQAENNLQLAFLDLVQVLEISDAEGFDIVSPESLLEEELSLLSADEIYKSALESRPEIKAAEQRLYSSKKNVEIAKAGYLPSLSLGAQWGTGYYYLSNNNINTPFGEQLSNNMSTGIGLNLSIPIFNRFEVKNQVKSAELNVESSKLTIDNTKIELRKSIQQAYLNAVAAKKQWESSQKSVVANEESYRFAVQKLEAGRANPYEVNVAKTSLSQSISDQTQAKYEYAFRMKILELMK